MGTDEIDDDDVNESNAFEKKGKKINQSNKEEDDNITGEQGGRSAFAPKLDTIKVAKLEEEHTLKSITRTNITCVFAVFGQTMMLMMMMMVN